MARDWSDREIEAIVADYLSMLEDEQAGRGINKTEHRRELIDVLDDRSPGSIEFKHQNISAVMDELGFPFIAGYLPRKNYQSALFEAVEARLRQNPGLHALLTGERVAGRPGLQQVLFQQGLDFEDPPPSRKMPQQAVPQDIRRIISRFEPPAERDARNRALGKAGEELVFAVERRRLVQEGRGDLADRVRWVARDDGDGCGYDILSFEGIGSQADKERWLEVKTTTGSKATPFFITSNELRVSEENPDKFRVVRLYDFRRQARAYRLEPPLEQHVQLSPTIYRASP